MRIRRPQFEIISFAVPIPFDGRRLDQLLDDLSVTNLSVCLRGTKLTGYEGGIRTPLVVRWPAVVRKGGRITKQVGHVIDFMATCLDVAGAKYPTEFRRRKPLPLEGQSLLPVFQCHERKGHEVLYWSVPKHHVIRMGKWKAIRPRNSPTWQLFDLEADGTETTDLAKRESNRVRKLAARFEQWRQKVGST